MLFSVTLFLQPAFITYSEATAEPLTHARIARDGHSHCVAFSTNMASLVLLDVCSQPGHLHENLRPLLSTTHTNAQRLQRGV